jgi:hypothetical protein
VPEMYFSTVAVFWMEIIKLGICLAMAYRDQAENGLEGYEANWEMHSLIYCTTAFCHKNQLAQTAETSDSEQSEGHAESVSPLHPVHSAEQPPLRGRLPLECGHFHGKRKKHID